MNLYSSSQTYVDVESRATFVKKTCAHLFMDIAAFVFIEMYLFSSGKAAVIAKALLGVNWLLVLGGFMVAGWLATSVADSAETKGAQYCALPVYIIAECVIFCPLLYIANAYFPDVIQSAAQVTLAGFAGLTLIAFYTQKDFSFLRTFIMWGEFCALGLIAFAVIFGLHPGVIFSFAMVALAGAAILYDTSNIIHHYP